jgi:hypothetical protein
MQQVIFIFLILLKDYKLEFLNQERFRNHKSSEFYGTSLKLAIKAICRRGDAKDKPAFIEIASLDSM